MAVILCNISALEYWRCPPIIRDAEISPSAFKHCDERSDEFLSLVKPRANAREAERLIAGRLFTDLKSLSLPIDVMVDDSTTRNDHRFLRLHRIPSALNRSSVMPIGGGLSVLSPEAALTLCSPSLSKFRLAQLACEFCGIYSCAPQTTRTDIVLDELLSTHELEHMAHRTHKTLPDFMTPRSSAPWVPSIPKSGQPATLWRRPPFFSSDELASFLIANSRLRGSKKLASAMTLIKDGLASPLEAKVLIMMCAHRASGGYGLPFPQINEPIAMSVAASSLYSVKQVYADFLWPESKTILEVDGEAFHADEQGFLIQSGRTASLQSMGYRIHNINYQQLADFDQFIAIMDAVAFDLGILPPNKTGSFIVRADELRKSVLQRDRFVS